MATITYSSRTSSRNSWCVTTLANNQLLPHVVTLEHGNLFFTFDTDSPGNAAFQDVMFSRFSSTGSALDNVDQVVSAGVLTDDEEDSAIAILANGNVVIVNEDNDSGDDDVEFHIYTSAGDRSARKISSRKPKARRAITRPIPWSRASRAAGSSSSTSTNSPAARPIPMPSS